MNGAPQRSGLRASDVFWALFLGAAIWFIVALGIGEAVVALSKPFNPHVTPAWLPIDPFGLRFTFGVGFTYPSSAGNVPIGISLHWWNLPGTVIGLVVSLLCVVPSLTGRSEILNEPNQSSGPTLASGTSPAGQEPSHR
jgi:hypothetical protein